MGGHLLLPPRDITPTAPPSPSRPAPPHSLDIDWEYPGALDRGGSLDDKVNYANFVREFQEEKVRRGKNYLLSMATGAGAYGYQGAAGFAVGAGCSLGIASRQYGSHPYLPRRDGSCRSEVGTVGPKRECH